MGNGLDSGHHEKMGPLPIKAHFFFIAKYAQWCGVPVIQLRKMDEIMFDLPPPQSAEFWPSLNVRFGSKADTSQGRRKSAV